MKTKKSLSMLAILVLSVLFLFVSFILAEQPDSNVIQSTQILTTSTATVPTTLTSIIYIEIQNNSGEKKIYNLWQIDHKSGYPGPVSIGGGEIETGDRQFHTFTYNIGRCYVEWSWPGLRSWEKGKPYKINFRVYPGQKVIVSSNPKEKPIIQILI